MIESASVKLTLPRQEVYLLYDSVANVFSQGGIPPKWGPAHTAKVWTSRGRIVRHIILLHQTCAATLTHIDVSSWRILKYILYVPTDIAIFELFPLDKLPYSETARRKYFDLDLSEKTTWRNIGDRAKGKLNWFQSEVGLHCGIDGESSEGLRPGDPRAVMDDAPAATGRETHAW